MCELLSFFLVALGFELNVWTFDPDSDKLIGKIIL
jgi:hypothetical protein